MSATTDADESLTLQDHDLMEMVTDAGDWVEIADIWPLSRFGRETTRFGLNSLVDRGYLKRRRIDNYYQYRPTVRGLKAIDYGDEGE